MKFISKENIFADFIAGLTVAMLLIPQSMAYAELAGLPAYYGLYAAFVPVILGGVFGHLHQLGTGPVAMTSIITASIAMQQAAPGTAEYINIVLVLSLLVGVIRLMMGIFKMASLVNLVSHPVVSGFTCAGAMIIGMSQLSKIFGISVSRYSGFFGNFKSLFELLSRLSETHVPTFMFGLVSLVAIMLIKRRLPKVPAVLVAVVISIIASNSIGFNDMMGGSIIGEIPRGLPEFSFIISEYSYVEWLRLIPELLPGAFVITLISFMEVLSVSKAVSIQTKQELNLNKELMGQGIAAIGGSFFSSYPVSGSFSRTAMNLMSGAKTGMSSVFTGLIVMILLLFFTPVLYHLPNSVLAASIIVAVINLINFKPMVRCFKANRVHGVISFITFASTLAFAPDMQNGVILGVLLTISAFLYESMKPKVVVVGRFEDGTLRDRESNEVEEIDKLLMIRFDSSLNFLNNEYLQKFINISLEKSKDIRAVLLVADGINRIDSSGEWVLNQIAENLKEMQLDVFISGLKKDAFETIMETGLHDMIGADKFYRNADFAIDKIRCQLNN